MKHVLVPGRRLLRARFAHTCSSQRISSSTPRTISPTTSIQTQIKYFARRIKQPAYIFYHRTHAISATASALNPERDLVCSIKVTILDVPGSLAEDLSDMLLAECATSATVEEYRPSGAPEEKIFANDPSSDKRVWDRCSVIGYFPAEMDADAAASTAASSLNLSSCRRTVEEIRQQDWEAAIKDSYQPIQIAPQFWIVPTWAEAVDPNAVNLILEPGLAFGTGDHPTTRLCLRWLQSCAAELQNARVMDYGTGSGVLAVAALLLGAKSAIGTDIEPLAVRSATQNAALNNVGDAFTALRCGGSSTNSSSSSSTSIVDFEAVHDDPLEAAGLYKQGEQQQFDFVVANILQGPLVELAPRLAQYAAPGAVLGLSGILESTQAGDVIAAYSRWFEEFEVTEEEGWALVSARRKKY